MIDVLAAVRAHLREHFARAGITAEPDEASVTFLGTERVDVLRFGPDDTGISSYVSLGCSRNPMFDPTEMVTDALHGPRGAGAFRSARPSLVRGMPGVGTFSHCPGDGSATSSSSGATIAIAFIGALSATPFRGASASEASPAPLHI